MTTSLVTVSDATAVAGPARTRTRPLDTGHRPAHLHHGCAVRSSGARRQSAAACCGDCVMNLHIDDVLTAVSPGSMTVPDVISLADTVHANRLVAGNLHIKWESAAHAWSALRARLSHTRHRDVASGRRGQA